MGGLSNATDKLLQYMMAFDSTSIDLRKYLEKWDFNLGDKTSSMWGSLSVKIPFTPLKMPTPPKMLVEESKSSDL